MDPESRLLVEIKYGIDLSYSGFTDYLQKIIDPLPHQFLQEYGYYHYDCLNGTVMLTNDFRAKLVRDLLEYSNEQ